MCYFNLNAQKKEANEKYTVHYKHLQNSPEEKKEYTIIYKDEDGHVISKEKFDVLKIGKYFRMTKNSNTHEIILMIKSEKEVEKNSEAEKTFVSRNLNKKLPDFNLKDLDGGSITNKDLNNKVVVLNFWFAACKPCVEEMPELNKLVEKYKDNNAVLFLAPSFDNQDLLKKFVKRKDFRFKILANSTILDKKLGILIYPTTIILNKEGNMIEILKSDKDIFGLIDKAIQKQL